MLTWAVTSVKLIKCLGVDYAFFSEQEAKNMLPEEKLKQAAKKVVGLKQTAKAVEKKTAAMVFVAQNADDRVVRNIIEQCAAAGIPCHRTVGMEELGKLAGIQVGAAAVAVLADESR